MRRSVEEGMTSRFVTGERVVAFLKVCLLIDFSTSDPHWLINAPEGNA